MEDLRRSMFDGAVHYTLQAFKGEGHVGVDLRELPHPAWAVVEREERVPVDLKDEGEARYGSGELH